MKKQMLKVLLRHSEFNIGEYIEYGHEKTDGASTKNAGTDERKTRRT